MAKTQRTAMAHPRPIPFEYPQPAKSTLVWWLRFLGAAAFVVLILRLPSSQDVQLSRIDLRWLGFCMLLAVLQVLLDAFIWQGLLLIQGIRLAYPRTLTDYLASVYLGLVTPGHVGEYLAAGYVSMRTGITVGYALSSVVMRKILYWISLMSFGLWGLQLLPQFPLLQGVKRVFVVSGAALVILGIGIAIWVLSLRRLARKWRKFSPWQVDMTEFWSGMRHLVSASLVWPLTAALVSFSMLFLQLAAVLKALSISLPLALVAQIVAFSRVVARIVPISVLGIGSKDYAVIELLKQQGIDPAVGITAAMLLVLCTYLVTLLLSAVSWWVNPLVVRRVAATRT